MNSQGLRSVVPRAEVDSREVEQDGRKKKGRTKKESDSFLKERTFFFFSEILPPESNKKHFPCRFRASRASFVSEERSKKENSGVTYKVPKQRQIKEDRKQKHKKK